MVNIRVKLAPGTLRDLANSTHSALAENLHEIDYLEFYNVSHLVKKLQDKYFALHTFDPFKPHKTVTVKINVNEAHSYRQLMLRQSLVWENDYLANIEDEDVYEIANQAARDFGGFEDPYPYPTKVEQETFTPLFDALFSTLQNKETEDGNVALFSRSTQPTSLTEKLQSIVDGDDTAKAIYLSQIDNNLVTLIMRSMRIFATATARAKR